MKVVVHLNHGVDKSYILNFGNKVKRKHIKKVLERSLEDAACAIYHYALLHESVQAIELPEREKSKAGLDAEFVVGYQGYIAERLA